MFSAKHGKGFEYVPPEAKPDVNANGPICPVSVSYTHLILVSMYLSDGMPVDMILLGVAHFAALGKRSACLLYTSRCV